MRAHFMACLLIFEITRAPNDVSAFTASSVRRPRSLLSYRMPKTLVGPLFETKTKKEDASFFAAEMKDLRRDVDIANSEATRSEDRISELQSMVVETREKLAEAEKELKDSKDSWAKEKVTFIGRITDLTTKLQKSDSGTAPEEDGEAKAVAIKRQKQLEQDIRNYSLALEQAQAELQQEQEIANELKERLLNAEDKLEFEQMRFKKEKEELTERIEAEQTKLSNLSNRFEQEKKQFQKEKSEFEQKIERESSRVEEAQTKLERVESEFRKSQRDLKDEISSQAKKLREIDAQLTSEQLLRKEERVDLERRLAEETAKLQVAEKQYENDRRLFERVKADLEERIRVEKTRVGVLNKQLEVEQKRYADTKDRLESTIAKEKARLADVQIQLEQEQTQFEKEKAILKEKLEEGERIRKLKARQMHDRYNTIRQEMTELYEGAKRDARKERNSLTTKYTTQINDLTGTIQRLETDLTGAREAADTMKDQIESYELEKRKFIEERQRMEKSFTDEIAKKNTVIVGLRQHVDVLKQEVRDREETIEQYESSFRKILGLGRDLSKKRLAKTGSKLRNIVRRKKDKI